MVKHKTMGNGTTSLSTPDMPWLLTSLKYKAKVQPIVSASSMVQASKLEDPKRLVVRVTHSLVATISNMNLRPMKWRRTQKHQMA